MLKNNNKGAGLVTVVTVLAVSGILRAGVLGFAYQHYKNVLLSSADDAVISEVELCARLLLLRSDEDTESTDVLKAFYGTRKVTEKSDWWNNLVSISVNLDSEKAMSLSKANYPDYEKWTISYKREGETVISRVYSYKWKDGNKWTKGEWQIIEQNVSQPSTTDIARDEIELCAEKLLRRTGKVFNNYPDKNAKEKYATDVLKKAYGDRMVTFFNNRISVKRDGGTIYLEFVREDKNGVEQWEISYVKDGKTVLSQDYYYQFKNKKWQFAASSATPRQTEDNLP